MPKHFFETVAVVWGFFFVTGIVCPARFPSWWPNWEKMSNPKRIAFMSIPLWVWWLLMALVRLHK